MFEKISASSSFTPPPQTVLDPFFSESLSRSGQLTPGGVDLKAIQDWVVLEEKLLHDRSQEVRKSAPIRSTPLPPRPLPVPAIEWHEDLRKPSPGSRVLVWVLFAAVICFAFLYFQKSVPKKETVFRYKEIIVPDLELKVLATGQQEKIRYLNQQVQSVKRELRSAEQKAAELRALQKNYRDEILDFSLRYQMELKTLRQDLQGRDIVIQNLRFNLQEAQLEIQRYQRDSGFESQRDVTGNGNTNGTSQSRVVAVNRRYAFVVINVGGRQGAQPGQTVTFSRNGELIAAGRIEKVSANLSGVAVYGNAVLAKIQEGDRVSLDAQ